MPLPTLIIQTALLGDGVWTGHLVNSLVEADPEARIICLASREAAVFLGRLESIDRLIVLPSELRDRLQAGAEMDDRQEDELARIVDLINESAYGRTINLNSNRVSFRLIDRIDRPGRATGFRPDGQGGLAGEAWHFLLSVYNRFRPWLTSHMVARMTALIGRRPGRPSRLPVRLSRAEEAWAESTLAGIDRPAIIHPGASTGWREWPVDNFIHLARELASAGARPVVVGGPGESAQGAAAAAACPAALDLTGATSPGRLLALLQRSALFVGGDSGPLHLAAGTGAPTLGLYWGRAVPSETGPWAENAVCLAPNLDCYPCSDQPPRCPERCRRTIDPATVAAAAKDLLAGRTVAAGSDLEPWTPGIDQAGLFYRPFGGGERTIDRLLVRIAWNSLLWPGYTLNRADLAAWGDLAGSGDLTGFSNRFARAAADPDRPLRSYLAALDKAARAMPAGGRLLEERLPAVEANLAEAAELLETA